MEDGIYVYLKLTYPGETIFDEPESIFVVKKVNKDSAEHVAVIKDNAIQRDRLYENYPHAHFIGEFKIKEQEYSDWICGLKTI
jgi:hypothetical protein